LRVLFNSLRTCTFITGDLFIVFVIISEQANSEKDTLQKSVDTQLEQHCTETEKLKEELKRKLQTAAEKHEAKLQAEISKGIIICDSRGTVKHAVFYSLR